eukprot:9338872-Pyramimonas_sp.AAC.1
MSRGVVNFVTDNSGVADGWYSRRYLWPVGEDADLWHQVGQALTGRDPAEFTVLFVNSHLSPLQVAQGVAPWRLAAGNAAVDELAGLAAS